MALMTGEVTPLGSPAPSFALPATDGRRYALSDFDEAQALIVMFICNHCPYVKAVVDRLQTLASELSPQGAAFVAISSNDAERYPEDDFEHMVALTREKGLCFPYLYDESQEVARSYGAVCTPDFFVYDARRKLAYRGRLDDNWKDPGAVTRQDLRQAIEALLQGNKVPEEQLPSMGCSIKWKQA